MSGSGHSGNHADCEGSEPEALVHQSRRSGEDRLRAAFAHLEANDGAGGSEPWTVEGWPLKKARQVAILKEWAFSEGLWIPCKELGRIERGRMEHDLFPVADGDVRRIVNVCGGTWFAEEDRLAVFDVGRTNLIFCEGRPVPVDVIPVVVEGRFLERLREAVGMGRLKL